MGKSKNLLRRSAVGRYNILSCNGGCGMEKYSVNHEYLGALGTLGAGLDDRLNKNGDGKTKAAAWFC